MFLLALYNVLKSIREIFKISHLDVVKQGILATVLRSNSLITELKPLLRLLYPESDQ